MCFLWATTSLLPWFFTGWPTAVFHTSSLSASCLLPHFLTAFLKHCQIFFQTLFVVSCLWLYLLSRLWKSEHPTNILPASWLHYWFQQRWHTGPSRSYKSKARVQSLPRLIGTLYFQTSVSLLFGVPIWATWPGTRGLARAKHILLITFEKLSPHWGRLITALWKHWQVMLDSTYVE